jgi:magnesium chelatase subunit D
MTPGKTGSQAWDEAMLAGALFAIDPSGLGGVVLRGAPGEPRDRWLAHSRSLLAAGAPVRRVPINIEDDRLLGGLDFTASLAAGKPISQRGVMAECDGGVLIFPMSERIQPGLAGRLAAVLDQGEVAFEREGLSRRLPARLGLIALDEGLTLDERPPQTLLDRLAFHLDFDGIECADTMGGPDAATVARARDRLAQVADAGSEIVEAVCQVSDQLGVGSARACILTLRAARAHAALKGRTAIAEEDAAVASRLVLGPRARRAPDAASPESAPETAADATQEQSPADASSPANEAADDQVRPQGDTDRVVEAIQAMLPDDLLARVSLGAQARTAARAGGAGAAARSALRGRPIGSKPGVLRSGARLDLIATLRAATPWQRMRNGGVRPDRVIVHKGDFRIRRFAQKLESTTIFVVDASGSSAMQRLAEAKGAVELLLAKAYVTRSMVALIAFRGEGAQLLLPPTRSLTRAKTHLADLPGGGGTPLASGIQAALALALAEKAKAHTPLLVFLTDGRANIAQDGSPGRVAAARDALEAARAIRASSTAAVYIDTSARPSADGDQFARAMGAAYAPLPYLDANALLDIVVDQQGPSR